MSHNLSIGILDTEKVSTVEPSFLRRRLSRARYATLALPIFIVALVFGAGLRTGVQLKQHQDVSVALSPISPVTHHLAARDTTVQEAPLDTFVLNGLSGQAPQTRNYDFTVSQLDGSPDGVSKPMLVVNGMHLFRMYAGDVLTPLQGNSPDLRSRPTKVIGSSSRSPTSSPPGRAYLHSIDVIFVPHRSLQYHPLARSGAYSPPRTSVLSRSLT